jgi:hypothetical protein
MFTEVQIENYKSIQNLKINLGRVNRPLAELKLSLSRQSFRSSKRDFKVRTHIPLVMEGKNNYETGTGRR